MAQPRSSMARRLRELAAQLVPTTRPAAGYSEAVAHDLGEEELQALRGAGQGDTRNKPRGDELQGYGIIGEQPPVFDTGSPAGFDAALDFYNDNGFCVVQALSPEEIARLNAATDIWIRERGAEIGTCTTALSRLLRSLKDAAAQISRGRGSCTTRSSRSRRSTL